MSTPSEIRRVSEHVMRTSTDLPTPERIRLYDALAELIADDTAAGMVRDLADDLRAADRACLRFSFDAEDQRQ